MEKMTVRIIGAVCLILSLIHLCENQILSTPDLQYWDDEGEVQGVKCFKNVKLIK
jgi:hypothetical protein